MGSEPAASFSRLDSITESEGSDEAALFPVDRKANHRRALSLSISSSVAASPSACPRACPICATAKSTYPDSELDQWRRSVKRKLERAAADGDVSVEISDIGVSELAEALSELSRLREVIEEKEEEIRELGEDLEEQRTASATAANDAMTFITQLQREKAAALAETSQLRRFEEEKTGYVQEEISNLRSEIAARDKEILSLSEQLDDLRQVLENHGINLDGDEDAVDSDEVPLITAKKNHPKGPGSFPRSESDEEDDNKTSDLGYMGQLVPSRAMRVGGNSNFDLTGLQCRLAALEDDREATKRVISTMRLERAQLVMIREVAGLLCRKAASEQRASRKKSFLENLSAGAALKWVFSLLFDRKTSSQSSRFGSLISFVFGLSTSILGLALFSRASGHARQPKYLKGTK